MVPSKPIPGPKVVVPPFITALIVTVLPFKLSICSAAPSTLALVFTSISFGNNSYTFYNSGAA